MPIEIDDLEDEYEGRDEGVHATIPAEIEIKINGTAVNWTIEALVLEQGAFDHHTLELTLTKDIPGSDPLEHLSELTYFPAKMGASITVGIKATEQYRLSDEANEFFGVITNMRFVNDAAQMSRVVIEAKSPTWKMDQAELVRIFQQLNRENIAQQILGEYSLDFQISAGGGTDIQRDVTTQWMQTDWDFLIATILNETDRWLYYDGKALIVDVARSKSTVKLQLTRNVGSAELRLNSVQTKFQQVGWSEAEKQRSAVDKTSSPTSFSGMAQHAFRSSQELIGGVSVGLSDLSSKRSDVDPNATAIQNDAIGKLVTCFLQTNEPSIKLGNTVELTGMGAVYNGVYFVKKVTHKMDGDKGYYNFIEAVPLESAKPPMFESESRYDRSDMMPALVIDNKDPESRGRIKVKFFFSDQVESDWLPIAAPYAGADRGTYFLPEVGDEVLVGFIQGDSDHPVMLGALWNGRDKPKGDWVTDQNDKKVIYTRSGHQLVFDDTSGSEKISIIDKTGKNSIVIDSSQNTITVLADKDIVFKATENITFEAGKNFSITTKQGDVTIKATNDFSAEGMNSTVKAQTALKLEGTASLEAKGASVQVTGQANTTIKGNPIMLN